MSIFLIPIIVVIENPDAAPVGAHHEVALARVNHHVMRGCRWKRRAVELHPVRTTIEADVDEELRAAVENVRVGGILDHELNGFVFR